MDDERSRDPEREDEEAEEGSGHRKPMSVREAVGPPGLRGQKPRPTRVRTGGGRESGGPADRPTPVREAMEAPALEDVLADPSELPSRSLEVDGEVWIARETGATRAGHPDDRGAPLLQVVFYREEDAAVPVSEALVVGSSLEAIEEDRLRESLDRARPVPEGRSPGPSVSK